MMNEELFAHLVWRSSPLTIGEYLERYRQYVAHLAEVSDAFRVLEIIGPSPKRYPPIRPDDDDFIARLIPFAYEGRYPHDGLDDRGRPTRSTISRLGLTVALRTLGSERESIVLRLSDGQTVAYDWASAHVRFPGAGRLAGIELAEAIFGASVSFWVPAAGWLTTRSLGEPGFGIRVGWRTYLGVPALIARLPQGVLAERLAPGGVLVSLHGDVLHPADPSQIAEAKRIQDPLVRPGLLHRKTRLKPAPDSEVFGRGLATS